MTEKAELLSFDQPPEEEMTPDDVLIDIAFRGIVDAIRTPEITDGKPDPEPDDEEDEVGDDSENSGFKVTIGGDWVHSSRP